MATTPPADLMWLFALAAAPFVGSFVGLVAERLPRHQPIVLARSACPACHTKLAPRDLVPLISWLAARGRCRHCAAPLSLRYPLTELAALAIAGWAASVASGWAILLGCLLGWTLLALALIDAREKILPDALTLPLLAAGFAVALALDDHAIVDHAIGALAGLTLFWVVGATFRRLRGYDGLGGGDAKLFAAAGAWLGWAALPSVLLIAAASGLAGALVMRLAGRGGRRGDEVAFGPYLCFGFWLVWLYGPLAFGGPILA